MGIRDEIEKIRPIYKDLLVLGGEMRKMGIRDEIEKIRPIYKDLLVLGGEMTTGLIGRQAVLSILDKWELVEEYQFTSQELAELDIFDGLCPPNEAKTIEFNPGDHIAIYKRRGKEDRKD